MGSTASGAFAIGVFNRVSRCPEEGKNNGACGAVMFLQQSSLSLCCCEQGMEWQHSMARSGVAMGEQSSP